MPKYYTRPVSKPSKPFVRPADHLAGKGSIADTVRKTRRAMESGDETMGHPVVGNSSEEVLKRGYFHEEDE